MVRINVFNQIVGNDAEVNMAPVVKVKMYKLNRLLCKTFFRGWYILEREYLVLKVSDSCRAVTK